MSTTDYRWNQTQAAVDYDAAAPVIHPQYVAVQEAVLAALPFGPEEAFRLVDVGAGSGRLVERVLEVFPHATATVFHVNHGVGGRGRARRHVEPPRHLRGFPHPVDARQGAGPGLVRSSGPAPPAVRGGFRALTRPFVDA